VLGSAVVLLTVVLVLFAVLLLQANGNERSAAERRFRDEAIVTAALTESVFGSSAASTAQQNAQRFGDAEIDQGRLRELVAESRLVYAVVLDARSLPLAFTPGASAAVVRRLSKRPPDVDRVLKGAPFRISGISDGGAMESFTVFRGPTGPRVLVSGLPPLALSTFLGSYLGQLPNAENENAYVVDSADKIVATTAKDEASGAMARIERKGFEIASAPVGGSNWRIVLAQKSSLLYRGISSTVQWLILIALAGAGIIVLTLLIRSARTATDLESAYADLAEANGDLERANVELKRSNGELEQFASVASHDLQEPLRKVQTFGDQIERRFGDDLPEEAKDYLRRMRNAAGRMSVLIEDLLRFSRVTTHAKPHEAVDLARVARDVTRDLDALVAETHGSVEVDGLPTVFADPTQMRQLLQNLIGNGLKFHRPGEAPVVRLSRAQAAPTGMAAFTVSDNGIGFEPEYEERIFRVFERLHPRDVFAGTGIGLALCRKIAERHAGTITGDGRPGEGSVFTVTLPAAGAATLDPEPVRERASV